MTTLTKQFPTILHPQLKTSIARSAAWFAMLLAIFGFLVTSSTAEAQLKLPKFPSFGSSDPEEETSPEVEEPQDLGESALRLIGKDERSRLERAKADYIKADELFRQASTMPKDERAKVFKKAGKLFDDAAQEARGMALEQDALFMQGESFFFANDLIQSRDAFQQLQKEYPRNRHTDRAAARLFSISQYWLDYAQAAGDGWYKTNLFDKSRPLSNLDANAIRVLDQIRYDDPTGKLADDATMAAAVQHIRNGNFQSADEFLTDLRTTFTDSEHQFLAHMLGIRCKLSLYSGPKYGDLLLQEADELVQQTRKRFPVELREQKYADELAKSAAEVEFRKAEKLAYRARFRQKQRQYGSAASLYQELLTLHPNVPQADEAREALAKIGPLPASPGRPLMFMTKVFPSSKQSPPLIMVPTESVASEPNGDPAESEPTAPVLR